MLIKRLVFFSFIDNSKQKNKVFLVKGEFKFRRKVNKFNKLIYNKQIFQYYKLIIIRLFECREK